MSTFDGIVAEFPDIRIDYFRKHPTRPAPLGLFLSHVHSDHLQGLESCRSPFIYCSPATREILLRLEKYPHRMNFAKGILERRRQTYKHLSRILRPIPLETPTEIVLAPGNSLSVTLFDANHCVGAVMFLIQNAGNAILYTGDIRSELWWVNSLCRNPVLIPFVWRGGKKPLKQLDNIYLDTTFATKDDKYRHFPTKAEGVTELLEKVSHCSPETKFYFDSWTFGYEDVWQALSTYLGSQIHVDDYRYGVYSSLGNAKEASPAELYKLVRSHCGNHIQEGCLSNREQRIHSCEKGSGCDIWETEFIRITPVITRHKGAELAELGAGGGQDDLNQQYKIDLDGGQAIAQLKSMAVQKLSGKLLSGVLEMIDQATTSGQNVISVELADIVDDTNDSRAPDGNAGLDDLEELPLDRLLMLLAKRVGKNTQAHLNGAAQDACNNNKPVDQVKPQQITFPYSRHSSYEELCMLIDAFRPMDIHPCTVDERNWDESQSMGYLFGHFYDAPLLFTHDQAMLRKRSAQEETPRSPIDNYGSPQKVTQRSPNGEITTQRASQCSFSGVGDSSRSRSPPKRKNGEDDNMDEAKRRRLSTKSGHRPTREVDHPGPEVANLVAPPVSPAPRPSTVALPVRPEEGFVELTGDGLKEALQRDAYDAVMNGGADWSLVSIDGHQVKEEEL